MKASIVSCLLVDLSLLGNEAIQMRLIATLAERNPTVLLLRIILDFLITSAIVMNGVAGVCTGLTARKFDRSAF